MEKIFSLFNKLGRRERFGAIIALVVAIYFIVDLVVLAPETKRQKTLKAELAKTQSDLGNLRNEMVIVKAQLDKDPFAKDRATLDQYKRVMDEANAFLSKVQSDPRQLGVLLRQLLAGTPGVTLVSLRTLPVVAIIDTKSTGSAKDPTRRSVYRRGIEVTIEGNYLAMLPYLEKIQNMPTRVLWAEGDLGVTKYPDARLKLIIYTLSNNPEASIG